MMMSLSLGFVCFHRNEVIMQKIGLPTVKAPSYRVRTFAVTSPANSARHASFVLLKIQRAFLM
jgi:hypothetical protein